MPKAQIETFKVDTPVGSVKIPLDEQWEDYTEEQRERIKGTVNNIVKAMDIKTIRDLMKTFMETTADYCYLTFEEAKKATNGFVIMEGDWGGQHYLVCPMKYIQCDEDALVRLLEDLDRMEWDCNRGEGIDLIFRRANPESTISGCNGAKFLDELWIGVSPDLKPQIQRVLSGEIGSIH